MDSVLDAPNFSDTSTIPQATAATLPCRAGLEVEFHQIKLTFLKRNTPGTRVLWPVPVKDKGVPEKRLEETMIPGETILEPMHKDSFLLQGTTDKVNWEGDWGLKGVGAAFGQIYISPVNETMTVKTEGQPEKTIPAKYAGGSCIIELTTAAHAIDDYPFWNAARRALKTFHQVILKFKENPVLLQEVEYIKCTDGTCWVPIQSFLDVYNNHIDKLAAEPKFEASKFKLVKSRALVDHEEGVSKHKPAQGGQWDAFVSFHGSGHCDVQVNYQLGIRNLFDNVEAWIKAWSSVWMVSLTDDYRNLDGDIGEQRNTPLFEVYATQIYAAMWRLAKAKVSEIFTENLPGTELVKALCAYLLVCGSVDLPQLSGVATVKNVFPQLPKTSPASVAGAIELLYPEIAKGFDDLANPKHVYTREFIALSGPTCMRNMSALLEKGGLPNCSPIPKNKERKFLMPGESSYSEPGQEHSIIGSGDGQSQQDLENLWAGTFGRNVLTAGNRAGYVVDAPFFCGWANRVKTSKAAVVFKKDSVEDVYMLFESRFSHCVLNMGFNPTVKDFMFSRSYLALVELLCGQATKDKIADAVEVDYPDDLNVQQKFPNKHPH